VFYLVAFLRSAVPDSTEPSRTLEYLIQQNEKILEFCDGSGIEVKQYLPHYETQAEWARHFGQNWARFIHRKSEFDPKSILAVGQRIFEPMGSHSSLVPLREN
jgi:cytokinin dehydrogenase